MDGLTELLQAVLEPIREEAHAAFADLAKDYWPDDELEERCRKYIENYYGFWTKHSRVLHLRNNMSDQYDERMIEARVGSARPAIALYRRQMTPPGKRPCPEAENMASVLATAVERSVTVATDSEMPVMIQRIFGPRNTSVVEPLTRLVVLAIRDMRSRAED